MVCGENALYCYKAELASIYDVYDGDTIRMDIDLGLGSWRKKQKLRLYGIDTPEIRGEERERGIVVRDYVRSCLQHVDIIIKTHKDKQGSFGRWLAEVYYGDATGVMTNLNKELLAMGYAEPYKRGR